ncbi:MAG TPA: iron-containing alcohol dehydrogenase, partial [Candidatus Humimicrobiaceae bacterium]
MENFRFHNSTEIIFGKETENSVGREIKKYAGTVLLHYGGDTIKKIRLYDKLIESLKNEGIK